MIKKLVYIIFLLISTLIIANLGAWKIYPKYLFNLKLVFEVWKQLFPKIPFLVFLSNGIAIFYFSIMIRFFLPLNILRKNKYGYAIFASLRDVKNRMSLNFKKGIILGKFKNKYIRSDQPLSCLILAPPGTGKTAGIIIPNLLLCNNSMLIHDPKGELYDLTSNHREKLGHEVFLFDPINKETAKFNIFAKSMLPINREDIKAYVMTISNIIFHYGEKNVKDQYFLDAARSAFVFFACWLIWKYGSTSIPQVRNKLLEHPKVELTIKTMLKEDKLLPELKKDGTGVLLAADSENQWAGVMGELREFLEPFGEKTIANALSGECDFTDETLRNKKTTIYLKVRDKDKKRLKPVMSILIEMIGSRLISNVSTNSNIVTFVLDEFIRLGRMEIVADLPALSRGYNLNTIFVAQDYEQIATIYGREYLSILDSNCAYKIILKQNNYLTAEKISKLIGNKTVFRKSDSTSLSFQERKTNKSTSKSLSHEGIPLVTPQDILNMKNKTCLIIVQGYAGKPIKAEIPYWFKNKKLKKLINQTKENHDNQ